MFVKKTIAVFAIFSISLFVVSPVFAQDRYGGGSSTASVAVADQGQNQGQGQSMGGQSMGSQQNNQVLDLTFGGSTPKRGTHISPDISYPGMVADITGPANQYGPNFTRMIDLLKYKSGKIGEPAVFTREELQPIANEATRTFLGFGDEPIVKLRCFGGERLEKAESISVTFLPLLYRKDGMVVFAGMRDGFQPKGYFHALASVDGEITLDILAVALIQAMDKGVNAVDIMSEGANRELYATGWGIGFNTSGATVNDLKGSAVSGVAGGGTGWSTSSSGFHQLPWIQGHLGYIGK